MPIFDIQYWALIGFVLVFNVAGRVSIEFQLDFLGFLPELLNYCQIGFVVIKQFPHQALFAVFASQVITDLYYICQQRKYLIPKGFIKSILLSEFCFYFCQILWIPEEQMAVVRRF